MPATSTKTAPLPLGVRDLDASNRMEMLPRRTGRNEVSVDQLLADFARDTSATRETTVPRETQPRPWTAPPVERGASDSEQLRLRVAELETRVKALEAASQIRNDGAGRLNQRVLSVLEQLVAELRERR
jgi:hypothetical protein